MALDLESLAELARNGNARIYIGVDKHAPMQENGKVEETLAQKR